MLDLAQFGDDAHSNTLVKGNARQKTLLERGVVECMRKEGEGEGEGDKNDTVIH